MNVMFLRPDKAYHNTDASIIAVKLGEQGYWPIYMFPTVTVEDLNHGEVPLDIQFSAIAGSMFGWACPAAQAAVEWMKGDTSERR